jgi:hypothetical protein
MADQQTKLVDLVSVVHTVRRSLDGIEFTGFRSWADLVEWAAAHVYAEAGYRNAEAVMRPIIDRLEQRLREMVYREAQGWPEVDSGHPEE